jgi:DNA repair photolyase
MKIYEPSGRAREYSPLALNYFKGCDHGCLYCYVPKLMTRFDKNYNHANVIKTTNFNELVSSAEKMKGCNKQILLSFTGDPYCNAENGETRKVLEILKFYDHKVAILTKNPAKALKDLDIIKSFGNKIKIGTTLVFDNENLCKEWEKGAPVSKIRIDALKTFQQNGIKTWASFEPVIYPNESLILLKKVVGWIDHVKIGKINNFKGYDKRVDWSLFIQKAVNILRESKMDDRFYIKTDLFAFNKDVYLSKNETDQDFLNL